MERIWFEKQTIGSLPERACRRWGDREALLFQGRRWTFAEISEGCRSHGAGPDGARDRARGEGCPLDAQPSGVDRGDVRDDEGGSRARSRQHAATARATSAYILRHSEAQTLLIVARSGPIDYLAMVRELTGTLPRLRRLVVLGGDQDVEASPVRAVSWTTMLADGDRMSRLSSRRGRQRSIPTTWPSCPTPRERPGFPKGVMHDHAIVRNVIDRANRMGITPADTILMYLPLFHLFGFSEGALMSMATGARQVLTETFDPSESLALLEAERATILHGFDTHFKELLEAQARSPRDISSVRTGILATGMSSSVPIARRARQIFGPLLSGYGMSEFGVGASLSFLDSTEEQCVEASGYPAPGYEIRVIDPDTGHDQPAGSPGEILVRSYITMRGLLRQCRGDGANHRRRRAGCTPATWGSSGPTATCASWGATRTCSRSAARTSTPWRSRPS